MDEGFAKWMRRRGQEAMRKLWKYATAADTPDLVRVKLYQFFAEMGIGKATTMGNMDNLVDGPACGVVILPEVQEGPGDAQPVAPPEDWPYSV
jgi:hypothetical protein